MPNETNERRDSKHDHEMSRMLDEDIPGSLSTALDGIRAFAKRYRTQIPYYQGAYVEFK